ncbi:MAG: UvrB/UvrC motif-containing protein [Gemmatimonas sp.]
MDCQECKTRPAVVESIKVLPAGVQHVHLCEKCAREKGIQTTITMQQHALGDMLQAVQQQASLGSVDAASCGFCGATARDFRLTGRLGCAYCYEALENSLRELLRRLHGNSKHVGKRYIAPQVQMESKIDTVHDLEDRLRRAIAAEQFELAAELRDRIRVIE